MFYKLKMEYSVTSKKEIKTEKEEGTLERQYITKLSNGETQITIKSSHSNDLVNGDIVKIEINSNQKTLIEVENG